MKEILYLFYVMLNLLDRIIIDLGLLLKPIKTSIICTPLMILKYFNR